MSDAIAPAADAPATAFVNSNPSGLQATPQTIQATLPSGEQVARIPMKAEDYALLTHKAAAFDKAQAEIAANAKKLQDAELAAAAARGDAEKAINLLRQQSEHEREQIRKQAEEQQKTWETQMRQLQEQTIREKAEAENTRRSIEARSHKYAKEGELARALAQHNLVEGAAEELTQILGGRLEVHPDGDSFAVKTNSGQSANELVAHYLKNRPHFVRAGTTQGGTHGSTNGSTTTPASPEVPVAPAQPKNMGEAIVMHMQSLKKEQGDGRLNESLGFGLKAIR